MAQTRLEFRDPPDVICYGVGNEEANREDGEHDGGCNNTVCPAHVDLSKQVALLHAQVARGRTS